MCSFKGTTDVSYTSHITDCVELTRQNITIRNVRAEIRARMSDYISLFNIDLVTHTILNTIK